MLRERSVGQGGDHAPDEKGEPDKSASCGEAGWDGTLIAQAECGGRQCIRRDENALAHNEPRDYPHNVGKSRCHAADSLTIIDPAVRSHGQCW